MQPTTAAPLAASRDGLLLPPLDFAYADGPLTALLDDPHVLAVFGFGAGAQTSDDPRYLRVRLDSLNGARFEVWRTRGDVAPMSVGPVRGATDGDYAFGAIEVGEVEHGGPEAAAEYAYGALAAALASSSTPHVLRLWNYLDAINVGAGDEERYRQFCSGRARGMAGVFERGFPAATAIGLRDGARVLQVYWLAAREPGASIENPRQVSAWRYPRQYGPTAPTFARGTMSPSQQLLISGTAAVVGHSSRHDGDVVAQLDETLANLDALLRNAGHASGDAFAARSRLKVYVREARDATVVTARLTEVLGRSADLLVLHGDICRAELLVEIDGVVV